MNRARQGRRGAWFLAGQRGITLLELTVVAAILSILAALVAVGVGGKATESRESTRGSDLSEVQKAVDSFAGEHPQSRYPTLNGCLPGGKLDLITRLCIASTAQSSSGAESITNLEFTAVATDLGVTLSVTDASSTLQVVPIIWAKSFTTTEGETKSFVPNYVPRVPKHAYELSEGLPITFWKTHTNIDPEGGASITAPTSLDLDSSPVWVLDENGTVYILLPDGRY